MRLISTKSIYKSAAPASAAPAPAAPAAPAKRRFLRYRPVDYLILGLLALALVGLLWGAAALVARRETIFPGVSVLGEKLGGMTTAQATAVLRKADRDGGEGVALTVELPGDNTLEIPNEVAGWTVSARKAAKTAWNSGRGGNLFSNFFSYVGGAVFGRDTGKSLAQPVDEETLRALVEEKVHAVNQDMAGGNLELDEENQILRLTKGGELFLVEAEDVYQQTLRALNRHERTLRCVKEAAADASAAEMDLQALHDEICGEPVNAYYDNASGEIIEARPGVQFETSEAQKLWDAAEPGEVVEIPVEVTPAAFHKSDVPALFSDLLATRSTPLAGSSYNRINNITLAASRLQDVIVYPGQSLSYNETLGQRTVEAGFQEAGAYSEGQVVQEVGGGICQVSSTLYWCAMKANLKILERTNHYFSVGYIEPGMDATVSWGGPDFRFENNRTFPIAIAAYVDHGMVIIEIWGTDVDGTTARVDYAMNGMTAVTYRHVLDRDGNELSSEVEAVSTYHTHES